MFTKIYNKALSGFVSLQTTAMTAGKTTRSAVVPATRVGKLEVVVGAALAYCLYLLSAPAFAADKDQSKVVDLINGFTNFVVILVAAISVLMGVWAGLQFVGSGGNNQVASRAKNTIKNVVIGLVVCAGIFILKNAILAIVGGASKTGDGTKDVTESLGSQGGLGG